MSLRSVGAFEAELSVRAGEDAQLRHNGTTLSLLAWCLYRAGRRDDALAVLDEAFDLGAGDALLRARAREIRKGAT